jgi:hypothetical protein
MLRTIQVIEKLVELIPDDDVLDADCLAKLTNLVHFHDKKIREAVGSLILTLSEEFEDGAQSLLPLQKIQSNPQKIEKRRGIQL